MQKIKLTELIGGAVQEKFSKSLERVLENMLDINTPFLHMAETLKQAKLS